MKNIKIAVLIPTCNRPQELNRAIASIATQTVLPDELIIVNNSSYIKLTDEVFGSLVNQVRCLCINYPERIGPSKSRNLGVKATTSDYVAFLDDDDEFCPHKIESLKRIIDETQSDIIFNSLKIIYPHEKVSRNVYKEEGIVDNALNKLLVSNIVGGASLTTIKKETFEQLGGFDESIGFLEDHELWIRFAVNQYRLYGTKEVLTRYYAMTNTQSLSKDRKRNDEARRLLNEKYANEYQKLSFAELKDFEKGCLIDDYYRCVLNYEYVEAIKQAWKIFKSQKKLFTLALITVTLLGCKKVIQLRCLL